MINVLYITDLIMQRSGISSVIMNYLEHMPRENVIIDLLVYENSEESQIRRAESYGAKVYFMPTLNMKNIKQFVFYLQCFFEEHHYDIVHSHFNQIDGIVFPIARKNGVKCCISHSHNTKLSENRLKAIRNRMMCWNISWNADVLAACSEKAGVFLYGKSFKNSRKKLIVHNGIEINKFSYDPEKRNSIRAEFGIKDDEILIGHVGRFMPQKNHMFLIKVFKKLCKNQSKMKLMLVGNGELKETIEEKIRELGIENKVILTGIRSDANRIYSALDCFLFPSIYEGLGMVLIEAQCSGLKCFASDAVPHETNITGNVVFLPVDKGEDIWVERINNTIQKLDQNRFEYSEIVGQNEYDINIEAKKLEKKYIELAT